MKPFLVLLLYLLLPLAGAAPAGAQQDAVRTLMHQGLERRFVLHTPIGTATPGPRPLVVVLHGSHQPPRELRDWLPMEPIADREGFVAAYPDAIGSRWNYGARPGEKIDDLGFIDALVERLVARGIADPARIYVAGISRGALMTWTLLCRRPARFAAAAALSSGMTGAHLAACTPSRLIPILAIAVTADSVQPYDGSADPSRAPRLLSIPETMEFWRRLHLCTAETMQPLPHRADGDATAAHRIGWSVCTRGGPVTLFRIVGGEHEPPARSRGQVIDAAEEVWRFFRETGSMAK
ncbi:MAG TPA: PHB depolymerase family esterase [Reyranella sp.]|nr:PHB depolymerase family esterase [Reyranella sp.]